MDLLQPIEVLLAQLRAELAVFEARAKTILAQINQKAQAAGVDMPKAPAPLRQAPPNSAVAQPTNTQKA